MVCRSTRCCCHHCAEPAGGGHSISGGPLGHQSGHCPLQRPQQKLGSFASATAEAAVAHTKCATSQAPVVNSLADQTAAAHPSALPWLCVGAVASDALHLWLNSWHLEQHQLGLCMISRASWGSQRVPLASADAPASAHPQYICHQCAIMLCNVLQTNSGRAASGHPHVSQQCGLT